MEMGWEVLEHARVGIMPFLPVLPSLVQAGVPRARLMHVHCPGIPNALRRETSFPPWPAHGAYTPHAMCVCVGGVVWSILMAGSIITDLGPLISCNRKSFWYTARAINLVIWPCSQTWEQISSTRSIMSMCLLFSEKLIYSINKYCVLVFCCLSGLSHLLKEICCSL